MPDQKIPIEERVQLLQEQLRHIEQVLAQVRSQLAGLQSELDKKAPRAASAHASEAAVPPSAAAAPAHSDQVSIAPVWPFKAESRQARRDWEAVIGGNWFNKIGVGAIILGMAFFLRYAIENEWIGDHGKVLLGVAAGLLLLLGGERYHRRGLGLFARGLTGGGAAILYLSLYFAFQVYQLLPQAVAFVLMSLVTAITVALSWRYDSQAILLFAMFGGFFTPFWVSAGFARPLPLFTYLAILDLGLVAVAWRKDWKSVNALCFLATAALYFGWYGAHYRVSQFALAETFLTIFYLLFAALSFFIHLLRRQRAQAFDALGIAGNALFYFAGNLALLESIGAENYHGLFTAAMAVWYGALGAVAWQRHREDRLLFLLLLGAAVTFVTLFFPIAIDEDWVPLAWLMETLVLITLGSLLRLERLQRMGLLVGAVAWLALCAYAADRGGLPIATGESVTFLLGSAGVLASLILQSRPGTHPPAGHARGLVLWKFATLFVLPFLLAIYWTSLAVLVMAAALLLLARFSPLARDISFYFVPAAGFLIFLREYDPHWITRQNFMPVINSRFLLYVAAAALLGGYSVLLREKSGSATMPLNLAQLQLLVLLFFAVTLDVRSFYDFREQAAEYAFNLRAPKHLTLSASWSIFSLALLMVGIWKRIFSLRLAALLIFALTLVKVALVDFWLFEKIYRIVSAIVFGGVLVYASYLYQRHKDKILATVIGKAEDKSPQ